MRDFRHKITEQEAIEKIPLSKRITHLIGVFLKVCFLCLCSVTSAILFFESFPSNSHPICAWLSFIPFIWGIFLLHKFWTTFFYSWLTFLLASMGCLYWIYYTCLNGGGLSNALSIAAWLGLCAIISFQFALWGGSAFFFKKTGIFFPFCLAMGFVTFEWLHQIIAFYGLGFPWLMLGYSQWNFPQVLQLASFVGVHGISFIIVLVSAFVACAFINFSFKKFISYIFLACCFFGGSYWLGGKILPQETNLKPLLSMNVAIMQPNIDQYKKWDSQFEKEIINTIDEMGWSLAGKSTQLVIWPESTIQGNLLEPTYYQLFQDISARLGAFQIVGSNIVDKNSAMETQQYVGAYLLAPNDNNLQKYIKIKLVPFGEYIPFKNLLTKLFPNLEVLGELGGFTPGNVDQELLNMNGITFGQTICYESIFPKIWRDQNKNGAKFFINITNDAWFFKTAAPYQHLAINVVRAVETSRPVLRAANTGFSAIIDPYGRISLQTALFEKDILSTSIPLPIDARTNFYTQWGNLWIYICVIMFFTLLISFLVFAYE